MTKIAFIGAGSLGFTEELARDILTFPLLQDATLALTDIHPERLEFAQTAVNKLGGGCVLAVVADAERGLLLTYMLLVAGALTLLCFLYHWTKKAILRRN